MKIVGVILALLLVGCHKDSCDPDERDSAGHKRYLCWPKNCCCPGECTTDLCCDERCLRSVGDRFDEVGFQCTVRVGSNDPRFSWADLAPVASSTTRDLLAVRDGLIVGAAGTILVEAP